MNGTGGGQYAQGETVTVIANESTATRVFVNWTANPTGVTFANMLSGTTTFTMPGNNVTITANYRVQDAAQTQETTASNESGGNSNNNNNNNTGGGNNSGSTGSSNNNPGTNVVVTGDGIDDKDKAAANVNGATDNFVIKISESAEATEAMRNGLLARYGSLDNVRFFAMEISLYDETGTVPITDTDGISVDITLPIPTQMREYMGNNRVASVDGSGNLLHMDSNFTTIDDTSCVKFTATQFFSPYAVYVDTSNLSAGGIDNTPQTGDLNPKWFLVIGFLCISAVLFFKKDKSSEKIKLA